MLISLQINDENGTRTTRLNRLDIDEYDVQIEYAGGHYAVCNIDEQHKKIEIDGDEFDLWSVGRWCGNMMWDCVKVSETDALVIMERLRARGNYNLIQAQYRLYEAWYAPRLLFWPDRNL